MTGVLAGILLVLGFTMGWPFTAASPEGDVAVGKQSPSPVPAEAAGLAQTLLEERWKPEVGACPEFYGLARGFNTAAAFLDEPFRLLELRGHVVDDYLTSEEDDPRKFAVVEKFCFPILTPDSGEVGTLIVIRNRDENGNKFLPEKGEFTFYGYFGRGSTVLTDVRALRNAYPGDSQVYCVRFADAGIPARFLVQDDSGRLFAGESSNALRPLEVESRSVREGIRAYREILKRGQTREK